MLEHAWKSIPSRIVALLEAGKYFIMTLPAWGSDYHGVSDDLIKNARGIVTEMERFEQTHGQILPEPFSPSKIDPIPLLAAGVRQHA